MRSLNQREEGLLDRRTNEFERNKTRGSHCRLRHSYRVQNGLNWMKLDEISEWKSDFKVC